MASGYGKGGASREKRVFKNFLNALLSGSPRQDIDLNNKDLRTRSRLLYMTEPVAAALINQPRNNVVGMGIFLKPRIDYEYLGIAKESAELLEKEYLREFSFWAKDKTGCDATGMNNFYAIQQLAFTSWLLSGDVFTVFKNYERTKQHPYGLRLHVVEADRCSNPATGRSLDTVGVLENGNVIYDGVEVDSRGQVQAYHICNKYPTDGFFGLKKVTEWERIPVVGKETGVPNIIQIMSSERPDQYRGVPFLSKIIEVLLQLRRYREAEVTAAVIQSFFTVFISQGDDTVPDVGMNEVLDSEGEKSTRDDELELGPGNINYLDKGESATFAQATHPNTGFGSFCDVIIQHIAASLGEPKEIVLMAFQSSYSASRAAMQEAWKTYRMFRRWFVDDFCQPVYERWFYEAVLIGRIHAAGYFSDPLIAKAYTGAEWIGQAPGMIDPTKDIKASQMACDYAFSTGAAETMRLYGGDFYANIAERGREIEQMEAAGLNKQQNEEKQDPLQEGKEDE